MYSLFIDYIAMLREIRGAPWHSVGRRTLLIRRGLAKTATRKQLRDFVESVLRLERQSYSQRQTEIKRKQTDFSQRQIEIKRRQTDGDNTPFTDSSMEETNAPSLSSRSHFVQQVVLVSPIHIPKKSEYRKKVGIN
jgi:hypothetical protein